MNSSKPSDYTWIVHRYWPGPYSWIHTEAKVITVFNKTTSSPIPVSTLVEKEPRWSYGGEFICYDL